LWVVAESELQFLALGVHGHPAGEELQTTGMVQVQVTERDGGDVLDRDTDLVEGLLDRFTRTRQDRDVVHLGVEPSTQGRITDQRSVEARVQQ